MPPRSRYRPGLRNTKYRKGKFSDQRIAWLDSALGQLVLMFYTEFESQKENDHTESGPTVKILIPRASGSTVMWDLTYLTTEELDKLEEFLELAIGIARPIVAERDRTAHEAFSRGDDSFSRVYRQIPQLVVRERQEPTHSEGVLNGSEDVPSGDEHDLGPGEDGGVRRAGSELADEGSVQGGPEDDGPTPD